MDLFAVFKHGVFRQECAGIFSTQEAAETAAECAIAKERDDYHSYEMVPFVLNVPTIQTEFTKLGHCGSPLLLGELEEHPEICSWTRKRGVVSKEVALTQDDIDSLPLVE